MITLQQLRPYQQTGVQFLVSRKRAAIFDSMGLGKTAQAIVAARQIGAQRILVVAPLMTLEGWRRELHKWWPEAPAAERLGRRDAVPAGPAIRLIAWTDLAVVRDAIVAGPRWDVLIADEAHRAKGWVDRTQMAQALMGHSERAENGNKKWVPGIEAAADRLWMLTGTPMPNGRASEALPYLFLTGVLKARGISIKTYLNEYCWKQNQFSSRGYDWTGNRRPSEIADMLAEVSLRRTPETVPGELPPVVRTIVPLSVSPIPMSADEEQSADEIVLAISTRNEDENEFESQSRPAVAKLAEFRRRCGEMKVQTAADWVLDFIEDHGPIVLFVHHHSVGERLAEQLRKHLNDSRIAYLHGGIEVADRQKAVDQFADENGPQTIILGLDACGTGLNGLQRRTGTAAFVELSWSPATMAQAEGRVRRMDTVGGQCVTYLLVAPGIDERIASALEKKLELTEASCRAVTVHEEPAANSSAPAKEAPPLQPPPLPIVNWKFTSLGPNTWGVRFESTKNYTKFSTEMLTEAWSGQTVSVNKRDGTKKAVRLGRCVEINKWGITFTII